jgi:para-nitrobenzyl esterase
MFSLARLAAILAIAGLYSPLTDSIRPLSGSTLAVHVEGGEIRGESIDVNGTKVRTFRGIPFAAPPIGDLRWRPPQPVKPWEGVRQSVAFAPACLQPLDLSYGHVFKQQSEDCLYLNVWTASKDDAEKKPVMVWIHGGGNTIGGASAPFYDGRYFAVNGVVLVSIQYRLGVLGYLAHPALTDEAKQRDGRPTSGNYGLMDQIAALKWVQANIAKFGGDKDCVTVFGESAGAANITFLMASSVAKGLFHRAIAESGHFGENTLLLDRDSGRTNKSAHRNGIDFARKLGIIGEDAQAIKSLRELPAEKILSVSVSITSGLGSGTAGERPFRFGPVVDGYILPLPPDEVWASGQMHRIPFIAGSLLDDGSVFSRANPIKGIIGYQLTLRMIYGSESARAMEIFPAKNNEEVGAAVHRLLTMMAFRAPARRLVRWIEAAGGDSWLYHFSRNPRVGKTAREGVYHGLEVPYVFNTLSALVGETDRAIAKDMLQRWVTFAKYGDPDGKKDIANQISPFWPRYRKVADEHLEFADKIRIESGLDKEACDFLDRFAGRATPRLPKI